MTMAKMLLPVLVGLALAGCGGGSRVPRPPPSPTEAPPPPQETQRGPRAAGPVDVYRFGRPGTASR